jgi:hypothetical protein
MGGKTPTGQVNSPFNATAVQQAGGVNDYAFKNLFGDPSKIPGNPGYQAPGAPSTSTPVMQSQANPQNTVLNTGYGFGGSPQWGSQPPKMWGGQPPVWGGPKMWGGNPIKVGTFSTGS